MDKESLENFYGFFEILAMDLCDYTDGPFLNDEIGYLSEDGAEDLCVWIVSQGKTYWDSVLKEEKSLKDTFFVMSDVQVGKSEAAMKWKYDVVNPKYNGLGHQSLAIALYQDRFEEDLLDYAKRDEIRERLYALYS